MFSVGFSLSQRVSAEVCQVKAQAWGSGVYSLCQLVQVVDGLHWIPGGWYQVGVFRLVGVGCPNYLSIL